MSLQRRLTLFFIVIVMLPLLAAGLVVRYVVIGEVEERARMALTPALDATAVSYSLRSASLDEVVVATVTAGMNEARLRRLVVAGERGPLERALRENLRAEEDALDFMGVVDRSGKPLAFVGDEPQFAEGFDVSRGEIIDEAEKGKDATAFGRGFVTTSLITLRDESGARVGGVLGGYWVDHTQLVGDTPQNVELAFLSGDRVVASSTGSDQVPSTGEAAAYQDQDLAGVRLVAWSPRSPIETISEQVILALLGLLLLALIPISLLAHLLARLITQPLDEVARGADAVSQGRFDYQIPVESSDEVGQLAMAFNEMTDRLRETITELSSSRGQLQRAVRRVGETLRSTHDMGQILESILNTAGDAVGADAAVLWSFTPNRSELYPAIGRGVRIAELARVKVGTGVVGHIAERGVTVLQPSPEGGPRPSTSEPGEPVYIGAPLYSDERIQAVMTLYRHDARRPFSRSDLETVIFLAEQGGVALENVQLHQEAQRLSITDGLTGVWNRRYFQMQFRQVLATSVRFQRTFSVLMLDLDYFKRVNDTFGHQRGDATLIEFAQRVSRLLREVDTVARYGGEEFICLLSETDIEGALTTAEKIRDAVRSEPFQHAGEEPVNMTVSIGVASFPAHGQSYQALVRAADEAMYRAKQEGRDCVRVAESPDPQTNLRLAT